jgi:hypothetical protein
MPGARRRAVYEGNPSLNHRVHRLMASATASHSRKVSVSLLHPSPLAWRQADLDVFVAMAGSDYAGFVGAATSGYEAQGPLGENLGVHASVVAAQAAVDGHRVRDTFPVLRRPRPLRMRRSGAHGRVCGPT